jgi:hypothetical protein
MSRLDRVSEDSSVRPPRKPHPQGTLSIDEIIGLLVEVTPHSNSEGVSLNDACDDCKGKLTKAITALEVMKRQGKGRRQEPELRAQSEPEPGRPLVADSLAGSQGAQAPDRRREEPQPPKQEDQVKVEIPTREPDRCAVCGQIVKPGEGVPYSGVVVHDVCKPVPKDERKRGWLHRRKKEDGQPQMPQPRMSQPQPPPQPQERQGPLLPEEALLEWRDQDYVFGRLVHFFRSGTKDGKDVWRVMSTSQESSLGEVRWSSAWNQYSFFPTEGIPFEQSCLGDVSQFIKELKGKRPGPT